MTALTPTEVNAQVAILEDTIAYLQLRRQNLLAEKPRSIILYELAVLMLGQDASPRDVVSDKLSCAESVSALIGKIIKFPLITGTWTLWDIIKNDPRFEETDEHSGPGTIIISPTGAGNHKIRGHAGILDTHQVVMSNVSDTGKWEKTYTIGSWRKRYEARGDLPVDFFKLV